MCAQAVGCILRNPYRAHLNAPIACRGVCAVWRQASERPPQRRPVDAAAMPARRRERGECQVPQGLAATLARASASLGRSRDGCILRNPYCAFEMRRGRAQVCAVCTPHGVAWRGCAGYRWLAGRTVSRARILFGTSAAPLRDFARQFPPKPAPAAIRAPAPDLTGLTRSNDASPTRENTSFVHAFRTVAHTCGCATAKRPVRGARFGVPDGP